MKLAGEQQRLRRTPNQNRDDERKLRPDDAGGRLSISTSERLGYRLDRCSGGGFLCVRSALALVVTDERPALGGQIGKGSRAIGCRRNADGARR